MVLCGVEVCDDVWGVFVGWVEDVVGEGEEGEEGCYVDCDGE